MYDDDIIVLARLTRDIGKYFLLESKEFLNNCNNIMILNRSLKYLTWSKQVYDKAENIIKTYTCWNILKDIDQLIIQIEFKIK